MIETDVQYYCRRREQELAMEAAATSPEAEAAHGVLALFYAEKVRQLLMREALRAVADEPQRLLRTG